VASISGIAWDHINVFPTWENYVEQFQIYTDKIEKNGSLIYFEQDEAIQSILPSLRPDIKKLAYGTPDYEVRDGQTFVKSKGIEYPLQIFGAHNLQNLLAAKLMLNEIGVEDADFYSAIGSFGGAAKRLERVAENNSSVAYKDFAHSPSKLKATVSAVKEQYPDRKLIACMELHTFSSLKKEFLPHYKGCMAEADEALVYFSPDVVAHKKLEPITKEMVAMAFATSNVKVYTDSNQITDYLRSKNWDNSNLLLMSSGNFHGVDLDAFAKELIH
jgi:UDP-N-acetylmuramate: L-alanyl-gamma-D-glutamyl-meso-diaminopimelate ligase